MVKAKSVASSRANSKASLGREAKVAEGRRLTPITWRSLSDLVTEKLRRAIINGTMKPGQRIVEEDVAETMQTSRGPVRDAIGRLEYEGLILREPNKGAVVATLSTEDFLEVWSLRAVLEPLGIRTLVMRKPKEEELHTLVETVEELSACLATDEFSMEQAVDIDVRFHEELMRLSGHRRLLTCWQSLKSQIWFLVFSRNVLERNGFPRQADNYHMEIVNAIRAGDADKAQESMKFHLGEMCEDLLEKGAFRRRKK